MAAITDRPEHPWTPAELAAVAGVSARGLRDVPPPPRHVPADPGVHERVIADPAEAIPKVTEEVLRRDAPHRGLFRVTTRDTGPNVRQHLAFGRGLHVCPGAPMARAEIRVALETLVRRLPGLRLADGYAPSWIASYFFRGLESLDVAW